MKNQKDTFDLCYIHIGMYLVAGIMGFVLHNLIVPLFYCQCAILVLDIGYYLYAYNIKYKTQGNAQVEALRNVRQQLYYIIILSVMGFFVFSLVGEQLSAGYWLKASIGAIGIMSVMALILCSKMIARKKAPPTGEGVERFR